MRRDEPPDAESTRSWLSDRARTHDNRGERVAQVITRALAGRPEAVAAARRAVLELRLPRATRETLALLVSELVSNSMHHAGLGPEEPIDLRLTHSGGWVRLAVHDRGPGFAMGLPHTGDQVVVDAHGLVIVAALSESWGVERDAQGCTSGVKSSRRTSART